MNATWQSIADALRAELEEYGGLLGLFEAQQEQLLHRNADAVLGLVTSIHEQVRTAMASRLRRERTVAAFASARGLDPGLTLRHLLTQFPPDVQPMLEALIDEINHLIHRVRRGARQNQALLARAVDLHQEALRALRPEALPTYSSQGHVASPAGITRVLQATG